jgi:hypothetical protein
MKNKKVKAQFVTITLAWIITICLQATIQSIVVFFTTLGLKKYWKNNKEK